MIDIQESKARKSIRSYLDKTDSAHQKGSFLRVKKGARVMLLHNIAPLHFLFNGAGGAIHDIVFTNHMNSNLVSTRKNE